MASDKFVLETARALALQRVSTGRSDLHRCDFSRGEPIEELLEHISEIEVEAAMRTLEEADSKGVNYLPITSDGYPQSLRNIASPPLVLFYLGEHPEGIVYENCLAIVGSRKADLFGCELTKDISRALVELGGCIVSGLALGIDGAAHRGALESPRKYGTVAVLGNGLPRIYPSRHAKLGQEICNKEGLIISQFDPDCPAYPANFLNRNRIIAGLAKAVLVVEASERSGSLVTARHALEQGKDVLVIPGDIRNERFRGSHHLIRQGAYLVRGIEDILEHFPNLISASGKTEQEQSLEGSDLIRAIKSRGPLPYEILANILPYTPEEFNLHVLELELSGKINRLPGNILNLTSS